MIYAGIESSPCAILNHIVDINKMINSENIINLYIITTCFIYTILFNLEKRL